MMRRRFVMLDRDGTIIEERHYLSDPCQVKLIAGVASSLHQLAEMGLGLVVITNQSAIGRGLFDKKRLDLIHQRLNELLEAEGVYLDGIYFCPHKPDDNCPCRKPRPGLVELAVRELDFVPRLSFVVGDKACDIELGHRVGATTFLVRTGYGGSVADESATNPDYIADDLRDVSLIIRHLLVGDKRTVADVS